VFKLGPRRIIKFDQLVDNIPEDVIVSWFVCNLQLRLIKHHLRLSNSLACSFTSCLGWSSCLNFRIQHIRKVQLVLADKSRWPLVSVLAIVTQLSFIEAVLRL